MTKHIWRAVAALMDVGTTVTYLLETVAFLGVAAKAVVVVAGVGPLLFLPPAASVARVPIPSIIP